MNDPADGTGHPPFSTPITRRRALAVIGTSVAAIALLDACGSAAAPSTTRGWVTTDVTPASLVPDQPALVGFRGTVGGSAVKGSAWVVRQAAGDLVAFDPRCTHADCAYTWTDQARFACLCHAGFFGIDGSVISGPPPRPLDRFGVRETNGSIELEIPASFATPRPAG